MAAWAPLVPIVKDRFRLDEGQLGSLLLCMGLGSILAMPFAGALAARFGCRKVIAGSVALAVLAIPILVLLESPIAVGGALLLFGAGIGTTDVVMNIQAIQVEEESGRPLMSGFHGCFSIGGIAGAGGMTGLLALNLSSVAAATTISAIAATLTVIAAPGLLTFLPHEPGPALAWPRGRVLVLGAFCFILFLAEGSVLDWSGVLLRSNPGADPQLSGLGYAAFAAMMTLGRFTGDRLITVLKPRRTLVTGALCAAAGFTVAAVGSSFAGAVIGFALVGLGAANTVPVCFTAVGRQDAMPNHLAVPAITTLGYAGILAGPAIVGFVARATSLPIALLLVATLLLALPFGIQALPNK